MLDLAEQSPNVLKLQVGQIPVALMDRHIMFARQWVILSGWRCLLTEHLALRRDIEIESLAKDSHHRRVALGAGAHDEGKDVRKPGRQRGKAGKRKRIGDDPLAL